MDNLKQLQKHTTEFRQYLQEQDAKILKLKREIAEKELEIQEIENNLKLIIEPIQIKSINHLGIKKPILVRIDFSERGSEIEFQGPKESNQKLQKLGGS